MDEVEHAKRNTIGEHADDVVVVRVAWLVNSYIVSNVEEEKWYLQKNSRMS